MKTRTTLFISLSLFFISCSGQTNTSNALISGSSTAKAENTEESFMRATLNGKDWNALNVSGGSFMSQTNVAGHKTETNTISVIAMMENLELNKTYEIEVGAQTSVSAVMVSYIDGEKVFNAKSGKVKFIQKNDSEVAGDFEGILTDFNGEEINLKRGSFKLVLN